MSETDQILFFRCGCERKTCYICNPDHSDKKYSYYRTCIKCGIKINKENLLECAHMYCEYCFENNVFNNNKLIIKSLKTMIPMNNEEKKKVEKKISELRKTNSSIMVRRELEDLFN